MKHNNLNSNKKKKNNSKVTTASSAAIPMAGIIVAAALLSGLLLSLINGYYYEPAMAQQQNMTATNATTTTGGGGGGGSQSACAPTTQTGGGNQSTSSSPIQLIEQACMALHNNDIQGALMQLNLALNALRSNVTTIAGGATNATVGETTTEAGAAQQQPIVLEVQGTTGETIEDVQQRMVEEINRDPRLTPEQKTQLINQLSAEVSQQQPQIERAEDPCADEDNWVIVITYKTPPPHEIEIQCDGRIIADITPSDETGGEAEAAPQTTEEQGDPVPGLDVEEEEEGEGGG